MVLAKYLSVKVVDRIVLFLAKWKFGNLSKYGIQKPKMGPFYLKQDKGQAPIIDVGSIEKIKRGEIKVRIYACMSATYIFGYIFNFTTIP